MVRPAFGLDAEVDRRLCESGRGRRRSFARQVVDRHTRLVAHLPKSDASLLVRVTEGDDAAWARLQGAVATENPDGFRAYVEFIDAAEWHGASFDQLRTAIPDNVNGASVLFAADEKALSSDEFPVVVIDLAARRTEFRCIVSELWAVENNLNISNMDWEEFSDAVDADGVYRGFR